MSDSFFIPFEAFCRLRSFLRPAIAPFIAIAIMLMVGGPPMRTTFPIGMHNTTVVGSISDFATDFFLGLGGAGMPMSWQLNTGIPRMTGAPRPPPPSSSP